MNTQLYGLIVGTVWLAAMIGAIGIRVAIIFCVGMAVIHFVACVLNENENP